MFKVTDDDFKYAFKNYIDLLNLNVDRRRDMFSFNNNFARHLSKYTNSNYLIVMCNNTTTVNKVTCLLHFKNVNLPFLLPILTVN